MTKLKQARQAVLEAIEDKFIEIMKGAVLAARKQIAEAVLDSLDDPFDADAIEAGINDEIGSFDWSSVLGVEATV